MSDPLCRTDRELDDLWSQNELTSIAPVDMMNSADTVKAF